MFLNALTRSSHSSASMRLLPKPFDEEDVRKLSSKMSLLLASCWASGQICSISISLWMSAQLNLSYFEFGQCDCREFYLESSRCSQNFCSLQTLRSACSKNWSPILLVRSSTFILFSLLLLVRTTYSLVCLRVSLQNASWVWKICYAISERWIIYLRVEKL